jgi:hypothetical protein
VANLGIADWPAGRFLCEGVPVNLPQALRTLARYERAASASRTMRGALGTAGLELLDVALALRRELQERVGQNGEHRPGPASGPSPRG